LHITRLAASGVVAVLCIGATFAFDAQGAVTDASRGALWKVVQACLINHTLTGAAIPCLEVNVSDGNDRGYVILRPPLGPSDPILAPPKRIVGIEDPSLQALDAPNYFGEAWNARTFLHDAPQKPLARDRIVLAVNSRQSRTQDQLDVHIGCLSSSARRTLQTFVPTLPMDRWAPLGRPFRGLEFWGRLLVRDNLIGLNPFRLAAEGWPQSCPRSVAVDDRGRGNRARRWTRRIRPVRFRPQYARAIFGRRLSRRFIVELSYEIRLNRSLGALFRDATKRPVEGRRARKKATFS
jgi:CDP-diacylglycerol pyrophosphatase